MTGKAAQHLPETENATAAGEFCIPPQIPQQLDPRRGGGEGGHELWLHGRTLLWKRADNHGGDELHESFRGM